MPTHTEVTGRTKVPLAVGTQIDGIGPHIHIQHGSIQRHPDIAGWLPGTVIYHRHGKDIGAKAVGIDIQLHRKLVIRCLHRRVECCGRFCRRRLRGCGNRCERARENVHQSHADNYPHAQQRLPAQYPHQASRERCHAPFAQLHLPGLVVGDTFNCVGILIILSFQPWPDEQNVDRAGRHQRTDQQYFHRQGAPISRSKQLYP